MWRRQAPCVPLRAVVRLDGVQTAAADQRRRLYKMEPLLRIELTSAVYETAARPLSYSGIVRCGGNRTRFRFLTPPEMYRAFTLAEEPEL